jgi:1-deoxy-D-xylulose-5-phosphate reductoisomerase
MKGPISVGLAYPQRIESGAPRLDFTKLAALTFEPADFSRYPGLALAYDALRAPVGSTAVLNAANEEAMAAFLAGTIGFTAIHSVNAATVEAVAPQLGTGFALADLLELDARARRQAQQLIKERAS